MATRMLQRRGTAAEWAAANPVLAEGEIGYEIDTRIMKIGDGVSEWVDLSLSTLTQSATIMQGPLTLLAPTEANHAARLTDVTDATASLPLRVVRSNKDDYDIFTTIEWFRPEGTKASQSVLSGGISPLYTTRVVTEYEVDGTTVKRTTEYALSYDEEDNLISEVFV